MEHKNDSLHGLKVLEESFLTQKNILRLLLILCVILALAAGLGWDRYNELTKKFVALQGKHERLNRIYLQERGR